jgi:FkbM family methyltransferase
VHLLGLRGLPIRTVLDVGANTGQYARWVRRVHPAARVICFEPLPGPYEALSAWAASQGGAVTAVNVAVGETAGEVEMFHHVDHDQSSSLLATADLRHAPQARRQERITVRRVTLDDAVAALPHPLEPDVLVKADVQGYEDRVIRGAPRTLEAARACVLEVCVEPFYDGQARFEDLIALLAGHGLRYAGNVSQSYDGGGRVLWFDALFLRKTPQG